MPEPGREETVRVVALDKNFHMKCYKCEVGCASGPPGWVVVGAMPEPAPSSASVPVQGEGEGCGVPEFG